MHRTRRHSDYCYKDSIEVTLTAITKLMNKIANIAIIPDNWRIAKITPIFKKGDKTDPNNYRPISNMCSMSKVYEKLILNYIYKLQKRSGIILPGNHQHGFLKDRSTITACLEIQTRLAKILEQNKYALLYSTDLTAAFDMLDNKIFYNRMMRLGLPLNLLNVLYDFLLERQAYVSLGNASSDVFDIILGCVQGSILGPIIYSMFMSTLKIDGVGVSAYADDTYGIIELPNKNDLHDAEAKIKTHLDWLIQSGMLVNAEKTELMILHRSDNCISKININGREINTKGNMKVLGINFNQNLTWDDHVLKNINNCQKILHGLRMVRKFFDEQKHFSQITTSFLFSKLFYGVEVWSYDLLRYNTRSKLDSFYYKACRLILKDYENRLSRQTIDNQIKRATPKQISDYSLARTIIKTYTTPNSPLMPICKRSSYKLTRLPNRVLFYDASKNKIGKNCLNNRIHEISKKLTFDWLNRDFESVRQELKRTFFNYLK